MDVTISTTDYKKAITLLLKEKTPLFFAGVAVFFLISLPIYRLYLKSRTITPTVNENSLKFDDVKVYTVQAGDDLWKIAESMYGSGYNAYDIAQANKLQEPYTLVENQVLIIPSVKSQKPTKGEVTKKSVNTKRVTEYTVKAGEYLWQIAESIYGDGNQMSKLIEANNLPYPFEVVEGQKLIVP